MTRGSELDTSSSEGDASGSLRATALKGGSYLAVREALGMVIRLGGVVVVTRIIGPRQYGFYIGAVGVVVLVASVAQLGAEVWLIRQPDEPTLERYQECFSTLVVVSLVVVGVSMLLTWPAGLVIKNHNEISVLRLLLLSVPVNILWAPAQARIERNFEYRRMAWLELGGDLALYGVAVPLAVLGFGVWAPTIGFVVWQTTLFVGSAVLAGLPLRWRWSTPVARDLIRNGIAYSSTSWIQRLSALANPLIVGPLVGATGVGLVGLALRLVDTAGFALRATWRLGLAAISRIQDQPERLRPAMEEGMLAQAVALGVPMAGLAVLSPWLIPFVFGGPWAKAVTVYGLLALTRLLGSVILPQTTLMFARGRNGRVAAAQALNAVLLVGASTLLVYVDGLDGFGWASLLSVSAWLVIDRAVRKELGFTYWRSLPAIVGLGAPMLAPIAPWPWSLFLCLPVILLVAVPDARRSISGFVRAGLGVADGVGGARPEQWVCTPSRGSRLAHTRVVHGRQRLAEGDTRLDRRLRVPSASSNMST